MNEKLRDHVAACPLGWYDGKIIVARGTNADERFIEWLTELRALVGIDDSPEPQEAPK